MNSSGLVWGTVLGLATLILWAEAGRVLDFNDRSLNTFPFTAYRAKDLCKSPPCIDNMAAVIVQEHEPMATYLCEDKYTFPDGKMAKSSTCQVLRDQNDKPYASWTNVEHCGKLVLCPRHVPQKGFVMTPRGEELTVGLNQTVMCQTDFTFPDGNVSKKRTCKNEGGVGTWEPAIPDCIPNQWKSGAIGA